MGRGGDTLVANANTLLFGARVRGQRPSSLNMRRQQPLSPYLHSDQLVELAAMLPLGPADPSLTGVYNPYGQPFDRFDVYASSPLFVHKKNDSWRRAKMGMMQIDGQPQLAAVVLQYTTNEVLECHWFEANNNSGGLSVRADAALISGPSGKRRSEMWRQQRIDPDQQSTLAFDTINEFRRRWADIDNWPA